MGNSASAKKPENNVQVRDVCGDKCQETIKQSSASFAAVIDKMQTSLTQIEANRANLEGQLADARKERNRVEKQLDSEREKLKASEKREAQLHKDIEALKGDFSTQIAEQRKQIKQLLEEMDKKDKEHNLIVDKLTAEHRSLSKRVDDLLEQLVSQQRAHHAAMAEQQKAHESKMDAQAKFYTDKMDVINRQIQSFLDSQKTQTSEKVSKRSVEQETGHRIWKMVQQRNQELNAKYVRQATEVAVHGASHSLAQPAITTLLLKLIN